MKCCWFILSLLRHLSFSIGANLSSDWVRTLQTCARTSRHTLSPVNLMCMFLWEEAPWGINSLISSLNELLNSSGFTWFYKLTCRSGTIILHYIWDDRLCLGGDGFHSNTAGCSFLLSFSETFVLTWFISHTSLHDSMLAMAINMAAQMIYTETLAGLKGKKEATTLLKHLSVWNCFWWKVLWTVPQVDPPSKQNQKEGRMLQSDIFYVGSGIDCVKYGTRKRIWQKTVWLYALWMKTQLIFLARRLFVFPQEAADLSPDLLKGLNKSLLAFFLFIWHIQSC